MLKYVFVHEMMHIKKFDIVWNHLKYFVACRYGYNIFVFTIFKYIEEDLEILCDKLVLEKVGNTKEHKKEYLESILNLLKFKEKPKNKFALKLHPTTERMIVMKKYKRGFAGVLSFFMIALIGTTTFADIRISERNTTVSSARAVNGVRVNENNRTTEIGNGEYNLLKLGSSFIIKKKLANINDTQTLEGFDNKEYKFDMSAWTTAYHDGFATQISNLSGKANINYEVIIQENARVIYQESFDRATTLTTKADRNSKYKVIILNKSVDKLSYTIDINSYVR